MKIAIDFDGTCVDKRIPDIGPDAPYAVEVMLRLRQAGHKLILNTIRSGKRLDEASYWFKTKGVILDGTQCDPEWQSKDCAKVHADAYVDDRAIGCPLIHPEGFLHPCVNWLIVESIIYEMQLKMDNG